MHRRTPKTRILLLEACLAFFGIAALLLSHPLPAGAITLVPACARGAGIPSLQCALQTFRNLAALILGVTGSFALVMFVYGGFTMLTSAGSQEKVTKGKTIVKNAVIGIFLILLAGYIIDYVVSYLRFGVRRQVQPGVDTCADGLGIYQRTPQGGVVCVYTSCKDVQKGLGEEYGCLTPGDLPGQGSNCVATAQPCGGEGQSCCVPNPTPPSETPAPAPAPEPAPAPPPAP